MITMLAAGLCLPLTATAQSRYTQQDRYTQNTHSVVKVETVGNHRDRQIVSQGRVHHGNVGENQRGGLPVEAIALSAIALIAVVGLGRH